MASPVDLFAGRPRALVFSAIAAVCLLRIIALVLSPVELGADEAQYWRWSQAIDWGYYSKPPLIAWAIALTTSVFGDAEWAIRLLAPITHGLGAACVYLLGRDTFDERAGRWSAAMYLLMPGISVSSFIMSTDALLLPLWSAALLFLFRFRQKHDLTSAGIAGAFIGAALLAKYAALYLFAGIALAALFDKPMRKAVLGLPGAFLALCAVIVVGPNLAWNAAHDFSTVSHTTDNAAWSGSGFNAGRIGEFIVDQMAVFGPLALIALFFTLLSIPISPKSEARSRFAWLAAFVLPPLVLIAFQAMMSRAHANWAATAYPAASVILGALVGRMASVGLFTRISVALGAASAAVLLAVAVFPSLADRAGLENAVKRVRGWEDSARQLMSVAERSHVTAIMFDEREVWHGLDYYARDRDYPPRRMWLRGDEPRSFAEETGRLRPGEDRKVMVVSTHPNLEALIMGDFEAIEPQGELVVRLSANKVRTFRLYVATGYAPVPRAEAEAAGRSDN